VKTFAKQKKSLAECEISDTKTGKPQQQLEKKNAVEP
jgi:hypothetical protein